MDAKPKAARKKDPSTLTKFFLGRDHFSLLRMRIRVSSLVIPQIHKLNTYTGASVVIAEFCVRVGKGVAVHAVATSLAVSELGKYGAAPAPTGAEGGPDTRMLDSNKRNAIIDTHWG